MGGVIDFTCKAFQDIFRNKTSSIDDGISGLKEFLRLNGQKFRISRACPYKVDWKKSFFRQS